MNYLVTLYTQGEDHYQDRSACLGRLVHQCTAQGLDTTRFVWTYERFKTTDFYHLYQDRFTPEKHLGYWSYKPYILCDALSQIGPTDALALIDSDISVIGELQDFYHLIQEYQAVFIGHGHRNDRWTTSDAFYLMGCDHEKYYSANHIWGAISFWQQTPETMRCAAEFLLYNLDLEVLLSQNKYAPNHPGFEATRWNQGPLTNLIVKYGFKILDNSWAGHFAHPAVSLPGGQ